MQGKDVVTVFLNFVNFLQTVNYRDFYVYLGIYIVFLYLLLLIVIYRDAHRRYKHNLTSFLLTLCCVFPPNILIYLVIRSPIKNSDQYWVDLERRYLQFETSGMDICSCGEQLRPSFLVCPKCNKTLRSRCSNCQHVLGLDWKTCPYCLTPTGFVEKVLEEVKDKKQLYNYFPGIYSSFTKSYLKIYTLSKVLLFKIGVIIERAFRFIKTSSNIVKNKCLVLFNRTKIQMTESIKQAIKYIKDLKTVEPKTEVYYKEIRPVPVVETKAEIKAEVKTNVIPKKRKKKHGHKNRKAK